MKNYISYDQECSQKREAISNVRQLQIFKNAELFAGPITSRQCYQLMYDIAFSCEGEDDYRDAWQRILEIRLLEQLINIARGLPETDALFAGTSVPETAPEKLGAAKEWLPEAMIQLSIWECEIAVDPQA